MTQAAAPQQPAQQTYRARVYQAASGEWAWSIDLAGEPFSRGAGFESGEDAEFNIYEHLPRPYSLILDHDPDSGVHYGPVLDGEHLQSQTCPQCHGAGYLDGAIECPNCFGHGELYCLDDLEVAE